jgi:hypothetical protein
MHKILEKGDRGFKPASAEDNQRLGRVINWAGAHLPAQLMTRPSTKEQS